MTVMKSIQLFIGVLLLLFMTAGCSVHLQNRHPQSIEIAPVLLSHPSPKGIWQAKEVSISYKIDSYKPIFSLSGIFHLKSSLLMSFPVVKSLFVRIHFLDADGNLISTHPVNVNLGYHTFAEDETSFRFRREIPNQVEAFTFSYRGTFSDYGERFPDTRFIRYSPVH